MNNVRCHLKGCDAMFIQNQVRIYMRTRDVSASVEAKVIEIVNNYTISDCTNLIVKHGDIHDAFIKYVQRSNNRIITTNKLQFHRNLAFIYVKEIINAKINHKVGIMIAKMHGGNNCSDRICAICINDTPIADTDLFMTSCNHVYHRHCILPWLNSHTTCPTCRQDIAIH